jgi:hypothetical protein
MWPLQDAFRHLRSASGTVVDLFYDRTVAKYWPLEARGNLYTLPRRRSGSGNSLHHSRSRRLQWVVVVVLVVITLVLVAAFSRKSFAGDRSGHNSPTIPGLSTSGLEHPVSQLVRIAEARFQSSRAAQSTTLDEAVREYQRRYHMPPPPLFDEWYRFARQHNTEMIDEFDTIHSSLILFWAISPETIRRRAREALGYDNSLMGVSIRNGTIRVIGSGQDEFQVTATMDMVKDETWTSRLMSTTSLGFSFHTRTLNE